MRNAEVPWARPRALVAFYFGSFELPSPPIEGLKEIITSLALRFPDFQRMLKVNPQRIWTIFNHWISKAKVADDISLLTQLGIDETSSKKGHKYVTLGVDLDESRVIYVTEGKGKATLHNIQNHLKDKGVEKCYRLTQIQYGFISCHLHSGCGESLFLLKLVLGYALNAQASRQKLNAQKPLIAFGALRRPAYVPLRHYHS